MPGAVVPAPLSGGAPNVIGVPAPAVLPRRGGGFAAGGAAGGTVLPGAGGGFVLPGVGTWTGVRGAAAGGRGDPPGSTDEEVPPGSVLPRRCGTAGVAGMIVGLSQSRSSRSPSGAFADAALGWPAPP